MFKGNGKYEIKGEQLIIEAERKTDFFVNPIDGTIAANAAFLYEEVTGDFVCKAKIASEHKEKYDAGVLMAFEDDRHWAKACFELGEFGFKSVCMVMTNEFSDDCNGATIEQDEIWLQLARTGNTFTVHYSLDGEKYFLSRICSMPFGETLKVGFEAQSPAGEGVKSFFTEYSVEKRSLEDPRMGK